MKLHPDPLFEPEKVVRSCYTLRSLVRFSVERAGSKPFAAVAENSKIRILMDDAQLLRRDFFDGA